MKRGFTLIELLVVMSIMGLLGALSVGGYVAMQRGMEERGVMQSVNSFLRSAYQRAQIDRQPVLVFLWNETIRGQSDEQNEVVVGRAVAVRRYGRLSDVREGGDLLVDEFADLGISYDTMDEESSGAGASSPGTMYLYPIENVSSFKRSTVSLTVKDATQDESYLFRNDSEREKDVPLQPATGDGESKDGPDAIPSHAFVVTDNGGVSWKPGMAYGMEFIALRLPQNYVFGSQYSTSIGQPVSGEKILRFGFHGTSGAKTVEVYSLRPDGASLQAVKVASSDPPDQKEY